MASRGAPAAAADNDPALDPNSAHCLRQLLLVTLASIMDPAWLGLPEGEHALPALPPWLLRLEPPALFASAAAKWVRGAAEGHIRTEGHSAVSGYKEDGAGSFLQPEPLGSVQAAFEDLLNASFPLNVHARTEALLALPWFPNRVANLLLLEPDPEQGQGQAQVKWRVRPSPDPLGMSPGALLTEARSLFAQQRASPLQLPLSVLRESPRSPPVEGGAAGGGAGGGAAAMSVSTHRPASGAAAPTAPCVLPGHRGHTNEECRQQHGAQAPPRPPRAHQRGVPAAARCPGQGRGQRQA